MGTRQGAARFFLFLAGAAAILPGCGGTNDADGIRVSGNIEATTVEAAFRIAGRVVARPVDEGMKVSAGQLLALLDNADLENEVGMRQAELAAAAATLREAEAGPRPQ